jgi:hypothetical protein
VDEIPSAQGALFAFDDQERLAEEDEEVLRIGFPVVQPDRLTGPEDHEADPELPEVGLGLLLGPAGERQVVTSPVAANPPRSALSSPGWVRRPPPNLCSRG